MVEITNISYGYNSDPELFFPDWVVPTGGNGVILGPSGCGKTTLLHIMGGLLKPASGEVLISETSITQLSTSQLDKFRGAHIGFVFQNPHLISSLTVRDNIRLATFLGKRKAKEQEVDQVLSDLGISHLAKRKIHEISQGQSQRVAIARAVINEPAIILGDEPTASLDDESCDAVIHLLKEQAARHHATLVIATHDQRVKSEFKNQLQL